jgi:hypothetical protein
MLNKSMPYLFSPVHGNSRRERHAGGWRTRTARSCLDLLGRPPGPPHLAFAGGTVMASACATGRSRTQLDKIQNVTDRLDAELAR